MITTDATLSEVMLRRKAASGLITMSRKRSALRKYMALVILGLLALTLSESASWQALGVGLWLPGAGFLAAGGWWSLLFPVTLALFLVALFAWLTTGMLLAPLAIWFGSAAIAGLVAGSEIWLPAPLITAILVVAVYFLAARKNKARRTAQLELKAERNRYLPDAIREVESRAVPAQAASERELDDRQLAALRYCVDRGLQASEDWSNYTKIDQFQPAAYRYQINNLGYALGVAQCHYTPNFRGYMSEAQRNLIEKYLRKENWSYWRLERLWGSFSTDFDPAGVDNIMLTGFYGINLGLYESNTGDSRYSLPGALTFRLNKSTAYPHDFHTITESIVTNMQVGEFCLYPCEPNWIYTPCNFRGLTTMSMYDRLYNTDNVERIKPTFMENLYNEFTTADGNLLTVMSSHTGLAIPAAFGNDSRAIMMNPFARDEAVMAWAMARHDLVDDTAQGVELKLAGSGVDFGNYTKGHVATLASIACTAGEMGDLAVKQAAVDKLHQDYAPEMKDGVAFYPASNGTRAYIAQALISQKDDWSNAINKGPGPHALNGPLLESVSYPDVLVAKAVSSDGEGLSLVLLSEGGNQKLEFSRMRPGAGYILKGPEGRWELTADGDGCGSVIPAFMGRCELELSLM